jgi:hypothetical protein
MIDCHPNHFGSAAFLACSDPGGGSTLQPGYMFGYGG